MEWDKFDQFDCKTDFNDYLINIQEPISDYETEGNSENMQMLYVSLIN